MRKTAAWMAPLVILLLFVLLRAYHLGAPILDHSDWRQADTASIARFYYLEGVRLLHPQVLYDGPGPNYAQVELPIGEALAAMAAHLFGWSSALLHGVAIALSVGSLIALYFFVRLEVGNRAAGWAALLYALAPLGIFYGRAFQAEPAMMCFGLVALWAFSAWSHRPSAGRLVFASALFAVAIAAKLPNAILGLPILWILLRGRSGRWLVRLVLALGLPYVLAGVYTAASGLSATDHGDFVTRIALAVLTKPNWQEGGPRIAAFWSHNLLLGAAGWGMAVLAPFGLVALPPKARGAFFAWGVALLVWCVLLVSRIRQDYYLLICVPFLAAVGGVALDAAFRRGRRLGVAAAVLAVGLIVLADVRFLPPLYRLDRATWAVAQVIDAACPTGPVVVGTENPAVLYAAWREGWRTSAIGVAQLRSWIQSGATVVVPLGASVSPGAQGWLLANARAVSGGGTRLYVVGACGARG